MYNILTPSTSDVYVDDRKVTVNVGLHTEWSGVTNRSNRWLTAWAYERAGRPLNAVITIVEEE